MTVDGLYSEEHARLDVHEAYGHTLRYRFLNRRKHVVESAHVFLFLAFGPEKMSNLHGTKGSIVGIAALS